MENILVSACLLGEKCRYNAEAKPNEKIIGLNKKYNTVAVCPEMLGGLETPRPPAEIKNGRVIARNGKDVTKMFETGAEKALEIAKNNNCKAAILKAKSPSCGKGVVYDGSFSGKLICGDGVTAKLLEKNDIFIVDENSIGKLDEFFNRGGIK